jgi:hypothetical protein
MLLVTSNYNYEYKLIYHCNNFQSIGIEEIIPSRGKQVKFTREYKIKYTLINF